MSSPDKVIREDILAVSAYHVPPAVGLVKLDAMENPYRLPEDLCLEIAQIVARAPINRYPDPTASALKSKLRQVMNIPTGCDVLLGNGSDEIIQMAIVAASRPGAVIMAPEPTFVMYRLDAVFAKTRYEGVPLNADFSLDVSRFLDAIERHRPALVFFPYPNNPSGNLFPEEDVAKIVARSPGLVVLDEAYHVFAGRTFMSRLEEYPNLLVMRTVSKLGLAGLRLGYAAARPEWIREIDKVRPPYNVGVITQLVAERILSHQAVFEVQAAAIKSERARLRERLDAVAGVVTFPSDANFILARVPDAPTLFESLKRRGVLVKSLHGSHPLLERCLRFTVGTPEENDRLLDALLASMQAPRVG